MESVSGERGGGRGGVPHVRGEEGEEACLM